jgi:heptosyltransferase-1
MSMQRILLIRLSAIGDVAMASGLIPPLRAAYPNAYIAWLAEAGAADLVRANPRINEVIIWPRAAWLKLWRERRLGALWKAMREFRAQLRARGFDTAIDLQGLLKSGLLAFVSGAAQRIGLRSKEGSQWLMSQVVPQRRDDRRIGSEYRQLTAALGLPEQQFAMDIAVAAADDASAREKLRAAGVGENYIVICPFTTRAQKHWFEERWVELARSFAAADATASAAPQVVMLGGPDDAVAAERIAAGAAGAIHNLAGKTCLREAAALLRGARLAVGVDTGLTHIAIAVGTPTLALFGSTRPYLDPCSSRAKVLYEALPCSPCKRHPTCGGRFDCMRAHSAEGVWRAAQPLLAQR